MSQNEALSESLSPTVAEHPSELSIDTQGLSTSSDDDEVSNEETVQNQTPIIPPHHRRPRGAHARAPQIPAGSKLIPPPNGVPTTFPHKLTNITRKSLRLGQITFAKPFFKKTMKGIYRYPPLDSLNSVLRLNIGGLTAQKAYRMSASKHEVRMLTTLQHPRWSVSYPSTWLFKMTEAKVDDTLIFQYKGYHEMPSKDIWDRIHVFDVEKVPGSGEDSDDNETALAVAAAGRDNGVPSGRGRRSKKRVRNNALEGNNEEIEIEQPWNHQGSGPMAPEILLTREQRMERRREKVSDELWEEPPKTIAPPKRGIREASSERPAKKQKKETKKRDIDTHSSRKFEVLQKKAPRPAVPAATVKAPAAPDQKHTTAVPQEAAATPSAPERPLNTRMESIKAPTRGGLAEPSSAAMAMLGRTEANPRGENGVQLENNLHDSRSPAGKASTPIQSDNQRQPATQRLTQELLCKCGSSLKKAHKTVQELIALPWMDTNVSQLSPEQLQQAQQAYETSSTEPCHIDEDTLSKLQFMGAKNISPALVGVLRGRPEFKLCVRQVPGSGSRPSSGREGGTASAVYALENISAGCFVLSNLNSISGVLRYSESPNLGLAEVLLPEGLRPAVEVFFALRDIKAGQELTQLE